MTTKSKTSPESDDGTKDNKRQRVENLLNDLKHTDPVLRLRTGTDDKLPDITPSSKDLLESLLFPLTPRDFKSTYFRKKAVHITSNRKDRALDISENYMFGLDSKRIFEETSSESIFLWIASNDDNTSETSASNSNSNGQKSLQSIDIEDPNTAHILHTHSNYASYCRAPPELEQQLVSKMLRNVGLGLGQYDPTGDKLTTLGRGEVETFIGTKGHLTGWHTDFQENFTIQLSGRKKWSLKQGTVKHPIRGTTPHYRSSADVIENQIKAARLSNPGYQFGKQDLDSNAFGTEADIIMDVGDVLYFPAGMWHKVETLEEGVSINISLMGTTYASLVCTTLEHLLLEKEEWREIISSTRETGDDAVEKLKTLINDLPAIVKKLGENGLAEGILPPVLRTPPAFVVVNNEDEEVKEDEHESIASDKSMTETGEEEKSLNSEEENENFSMEGEGERVVDIDEFEMPDDFNTITPSRKECWKRNPLASLIRMTDINSTFENNEAALNGKDKKHLFVLNVNFAGNEMHESAVRVVLRDRSGQLEHLCSLQGNELDEVIKNLAARPPNALLYYGYIV
uniref:JmjC domain-containing protein n=1 Tax=Pseudo-nitzschia australis TaxID=44445 RepID=A0A7S4EQQ4_9STRA|mmetsp:Transcript_24136/g.50959  ORF Transcript_24136/g.50959 Transcript_24136/m.50959 type:complete len:570 (-) Transcript_24136:113-1822(-)